MKIAKKVIAIAIAAIMCVPTGFVTKEASAQVKYETKGVQIYTDLVPKTLDISVTEAGKSIETKSNVQFDLDCNVDCEWSVKEQNGGPCNITINSMGHVRIPSDVAKGTYFVTAAADTDKLINSQDTTVSCKINVSDKVAQSTKVTLNKELIEGQSNSRGIVKVSDSGIEVDGAVRDVILYSSVEPSYLVNSNVKFSLNSSVKGTTVDSGMYLSSSDCADAITGEKLYATVGKEENNNHQFSFQVNKRDKFDFTIEPNVSLTQSANDHYNMQMNQDVVFNVNEFADTLLPTKGGASNITWTVKYGNDEAVPVDGNSVKTALGTVYFYNKGKKVEVVTPNSKAGADADAYNEAIKAAKGKESLVITPTLTFGNGEESKYNALCITFSDKEASFKTAIMNPLAANMFQGIDYEIKKEKLGDEIVDVYYLESDNTALNLVNLTDSDIAGIADFGVSKRNDFTGDGVRYTVAYSLSDIDSKTFGEATDKYINKELDKQVNEADKIISPTQFIKTGIGYKKLTIECTGAVKSTSTYILRFVTDAGSMKIVHSKYKSDENEYIGNAVVHIRQGERDNINVYRQTNGTIEEALNQLSVVDPYIEYSFVNVKGEEVASATTALEYVQINGLKTGKVLVTATSVVDKSEQDSFYLYVNNEVMTPDSITIETAEAQSLGLMTSQGEVKGKISNIPLSLTAQGAEACGVPIVKWSVNDEKYATITEDGKLTTLKSTGGSNITVTATSVANPNLKANLEVKITDVAATEIDTIGELVVDGMTPVVDSGTQKNTGLCKANTTFKLVPKVYLPLNQTSADGETTWTSSNTAVATVDNSGKVNALSEGETRISITYTPKASSAVTTVYTLTVSGYAINVVGITCADNIVLNRVGATETIVYGVLPDNSSNKAVQFISSNEAIISVTDTGVITAKAPGVATITIASLNNPNVKKIITVTVNGESDIKPGQNKGNNSANNSGNTKVTPPVTTPTTTTSPTTTITNSSVTAANIKSDEPVIKLVKKTIKKGKKTSVTITNKAKKAKVTYTINKKGKRIISITKKGVIKGKKKGTAKFTVTVKQNKKIYKKVLTIKVK